MESIAAILKTLGHTDRLRILGVLSHGDFTVSEITQILGLSQPRVTQYIKSLEDVGVVERLKEGSWVFSRLRRRNQAVWSLVSAALAQLPTDDPVLQADQRRLTEIQTAREEVANDFFAKAANDENSLGIEYLPREDIDAKLKELVGLKNHDLLIDMGTGTGRILDVLSGSFERGIGIDNNRDMLNVARHSLSQKGVTHMCVQQGDLCNTALDGEIADIVTIHQVLHYLENPHLAVAEAARLLADNGKLIIVDFEAHNIEEFRSKYAHRRLGFSNEDMGEILTQSGLSLVDTKIVKTRSAYPDVCLWLGTKNKNTKKKVNS